MRYPIELALCKALLLTGVDQVLCELFLLYICSNCDPVLQEHLMLTNLLYSYARRKQLELDIGWLAPPFGIYVEQET